MTGEILKYDVSTRLVSLDKSIYDSIEKILHEKHGPKDFMGWVHLPEDQTGLKEVTAWLKKIKKNQTTMCVLGIGGSCLGAKAVYDFLKPKKEVLFFDNVDGFAFETRLDSLKLKNSHFLAISKSGETSETLFQLAHVFALLAKKKLKPAHHVTVITEDKASSLRTIANDMGLPCLNVPFDVGGRFSVFSTVGLAPLLWAGVNVKKLLQGAAWVKTKKDLMAEMSSYFIEGFKRAEWISVFWSYVDSLKTFGLWVEQLWAESLGKARTRKGAAAPRTSTPLTCIGATDQHSLLQQFTEGARDKQFLFIRCEESEKSAVLKKPAHPKLELTRGRSVGELLKIEAAATQKILHDLGIPTSRLKLVKHDEATFGALIFLFEMIVAVIGECLDINAFDQPGVEAVKKVTLGTLGDPRYADQRLTQP